MPCDWPAEVTLIGECIGFVVKPESSGKITEGVMKGRNILVCSPDGWLDSRRPERVFLAILNLSGKGCVEAIIEGGDLRITGYIEEQGLGQPESMPGKLGVMAAQFVIGASAAGVVAEKDWRKVGPLGGVVAMAACYLADTILPLTGPFYWVRSVFMVPVGAGALIGLYQKRQLESSAVEALSWSRQLRSGEV